MALKAMIGGGWPTQLTMDFALSTAASGTIIRRTISISRFSPMPG
jgi:hypothetical protein